MADNVNRIYTAPQETYQDDGSIGTVITIITVVLCTVALVAVMYRAWIHFRRATQRAFVLKIIPGGDGHLDNMSYQEWYEEQFGHPADTLDALNWRADYSACETAFLNIHNEIGFTQFDPAKPQKLYTNYPVPAQRMAFFEIEVDRLGGEDGAYHPFSFGLATTS